MDDFALKEGEKGTSVGSQMARNGMGGMKQQRPTCSQAGVLKVTFDGNSKKGKMELSV